MPCAKILVVDDSEDILELCYLVLKDKYEVFVARNGKEAKEQIAANLHDLILLDIYMPRIDGLSLAEEIKNNPALRHIPIILMTGLTADSYLPDGFWKKVTPADGFLTKPFDTVTMLMEIRRVLAESHGIDISSRKKGGYL